MLFYTGSFLVVLFLGVGSADALSKETCLQYARHGNCEFYKECVEDRFQCGENGYPISYGYRYCRKFATHYESFTDEGKRWVDDVRRCLLKALVPFYKAPQSHDCDGLKSFAFASHPTCYTDSGFCKIVWSNIGALWDVFDLPDLFTVKSLEQILTTKDMCLCEGGLTDMVDTVGDNIEFAITHHSSALLRVTARLDRADSKEETTVECETKALQGDCDFYECLERRYPCRVKDIVYDVYAVRKGFASKEGYPLCKKLEEIKGSFTTQGQVWVTDFNKCLTRSLLPRYKDPTTSCWHISTFGYRAQINCFVDTGICDLVETKQDEFFLWEAASAVWNGRFNKDLSTILCRCDKYEGGSRYQLKYSIERGFKIKQKARVVDQTSIADDPCTNQGGKCQDYTARTCLAGYETGKCGGDRFRRCCLPCDSSCVANHQRWSDGDISCSNAGGQCKMDSNVYYGHFSTGLCGGPAHRRCCVVETESVCDRLIMKSRQDWGAQPPRQPAQPLPHPTQKVVIHHTDTRLGDFVNINGYTDEQEYMDRVQDIQEDHMDKNNWDDIGYNFLVDGYGNVYEGRGWDAV